MTRTLSFILLVLLCAGVVLPVQAHGYVIRSIPQDRATLERPPTRVQYWFSEALEREFSSIKLRDQSGAVIAEGSVDDTDNTLLTLRVPTELDDGAYIVELSPAFASDGHVIVESRVFFVGDEVGGIESQSASDAALPLEILWKAILYAGTTLLFGVTLLYAYVFVPVWGNTQYPQGLLPPRLMRRLNSVVVGGLLLVLGGSLLALLQQTMVFFNVSAAQAITGNLWQVVLAGSRFGDVWRVRLLFLIIFALGWGLGLYFGKPYPKTVRSFWTANTWIAALMIGAQAVNSHAAGSLVMPWIAVLVHWLHTLAVAFWLGGIAALALTLPVALVPYDDDTRWAALRPVMQRFSRYTVVALLLTITGGAYLATNYLFTPDDLTTTYSTSLAIKLLLVALLLGVGALHHVALRPHLLEKVPSAFAGAVGWARRFSGSLRLETVFAVLTLASASLLSATPTPEPAFLETDVATAQQVINAGDYNVQMSIIPGGPGVNTYDIVVRKDDAPVDTVRVETQLVAPARGVRGEWLDAEAIDTGLYVAADDTVDAGGYWWSLVDIFEQDAAGTTNDLPTRAAFEWQIDDDASVIQQIPPTVWNWLALAGVLAALGYGLVPSLRALAARLDWQPATVFTAVAGAAVSLVLLLASISFLEQQAAQINTRLNPPPARVNPIVPDEQSLAQGEAIYLAQCLNMQTDRDFLVLLRELDQLRDAELFDAVSDGWRDVPPCDGSLDVTDRWHVVNYMRTFRTRVE